MSEKKIFSFIPLLFVLTPSFSQNMNSPYSIYGIGDIDNRMYNKTSGMGGTGLALRSGNYFIDNNPAALFEWNWLQRY